MTDIQALLSALDVLGRAPDKTSLETANAWLQDFQHSQEAWSTCNVLLLSHDAPPSAKLFAAQTFRTKVIYDLHQVEQANLFALRDSLVAALENYHAGPRNIVVQLCLALADLALQLATWSNAVQTMIETFGRKPTTVPILLQFLTVLPEEVASNIRIPITDDEYKERTTQLLTANSKQVLELLSMYVNAEGVTIQVQCQVFNCLRSWLTAGEVVPADLAETLLFKYAFEALASEDLFDAAVDVICELIHETQEIDDNMPVIELIVPRVIAMRPRLVLQKDSPDHIKGYTRIFSEAGETYRLLLLQHTETFSPILDAIAECAAYPDLDIVPITFPFWMRLAQTISKKPSVSPLFLDKYKSLMSVIIHHLHFPPDPSALVGQEAEDFRSFRHVMGDTLKDCCSVLGTDACLLNAYQMITAALSTRPEAITWQAIEAPLFAMRSMGAEVDPMDVSAVPKIMGLIPSLPNHPRVRYAALLIISRYTEWLNAHPEYIPDQLQYVSAGFNESDNEVLAAAGQALKYLCQDCGRHLVNYLPTFHTFLKSTGSKLDQEDRRQIYEAIAYVISTMPMEPAAESLRTFSLDILQSIAVQTGPATKQELNNIGDGLENLEQMLHVIQSFGDELPAACKGTCQEAWAVFDGFLSSNGSDYQTAEKTTRVLRHGISLFGSAVLPIAPAILSRMTAAFEMTGFPSYMWIAGKVIGRFGNEEDPALRDAFLQTYERTTTKVVSLLQQKAPGEIPDVLEDYLQMLLQLAEFRPDVLFPSEAFPLAFESAMAALMLVHSDIIFAALDLFRTILTHDCLAPPSGTPPPPKFPIYASAIMTVIEAAGFHFLRYLLHGLVGSFPEDAVSAVVTIFRSMTALCSSQMLSWVATVTEELPLSMVPSQAKTQFLTAVNSAITSRQYDKVKYAIIALNRVSRKAKDRRRQEPWR